MRIATSRRAHNDDGGDQAVPDRPRVQRALSGGYLHLICLPPAPVMQFGAGKVWDAH
jgi:hypothetical protein